MAKESRLGISSRAEEERAALFSKSCVEWEECNGGTKKHRKRKYWCIFFS